MQSSDGSDGRIPILIACGEGRTANLRPCWWKREYEPVVCPQAPRHIANSATYTGRMPMRPTAQFGLRAKRSVASRAPAGKIDQVSTTRRQIVSTRPARCAARGPPPQLFPAKLQRLGYLPTSLLKLAEVVQEKIYGRAFVNCFTPCRATPASASRDSVQSPRSPSGWSSPDGLARNDDET